MTSRAPLSVCSVALCVLAACSETLSPAPGTKADPTTPGQGISLGELRCTARVGDRSVSCAGAPVIDAETDIVYGGQGDLVQLTSSNVEYDPATDKFSFDVRMRNLIGQAVGTTDGVSVSGPGIRIFFVTEPTATVGAGEISIDNEDGTATFTAADQPYFAYPAVLDPFEQSGPKQWTFTIPDGVTEFGFSVLVSAPVQHPTGWIEVSHPTYSLRRTYEKRVTGTVYTQFGREVPGAVITWSTTNAALATVDADSGVVHGHMPGPVDIIATSTNYVYQMPGAIQTGRASFTIMGNQMVWTAGAGNTDWNDPGNWDRAVVPTPSDSLTIPSLPSAIYPVLVENEGVERLTVADGATLSLQSFDLTATADVSTGVLGGSSITNTTGRLFLAGTAMTVQGNLPRLTVTGTYSLSGNVTSRGPTRVDRGRLRSTGFRLRTTSF